MISQIVFILLLGVTVGFFTKSIREIRKNILLGRELDLKDHPRERWKKMFLFAFGQKKMFKNFIPAIFHFFIYAGFILINIEILEIILDGVLGEHRLFVPLLGEGYRYFISFFELLALAVLISCVIFLWRRNVLKLKRFEAREMTRWPKLDANLILWIEIVLMVAILTMNAADLALQSKGHPHYRETGNFLISGIFAPWFTGVSSSGLLVIERVAWWAHIIGIFAFINYIPYSKHLHIFLAFPNTYYSSLRPQGEMRNMPSITREVKMMLNPEGGGGESEPPEGPFGAKDVDHLHWKNLLDAYSCTECGRCTAACPANITGKALSPRKIMMDTRDRLEEKGAQVRNKGKDTGDEKALLGNYITKEELNACTGCNACVEACPVSINPLDIILQLRRYKVMEEADAPNLWNVMFGNIENNAAPWAYPQEDRIKWAEE